MRQGLDFARISFELYINHSISMQAPDNKSCSM